MSKQNPSTIFEMLHWFIQFNVNHTIHHQLTSMNMRLIIMDHFSLSRLINFHYHCRHTICHERRLMSLNSIMTLIKVIFMTRIFNNL